MKTLNQFEEEAKCAFFMEYPEERKNNDYHKLYPAGCRAEDWRKYLIEQAKLGNTFPKDVCRSIAATFGPDALPQFTRYWPLSIPRDVLFVNGKTV